MRPRFSLLALLLLLSFPAYSEDSVWKDHDGRPLPDTPSRRSVHGFGGWLLITSDADWMEKWNTPPESNPRFTPAETLDYGESVTLLVFFAHPSADDTGAFSVTCDLRVIRPDGTFSIDQQGVACAAGQLEGPPDSVRLSQIALKFVAEPDDKPGRWVNEVSLHDTVAGITIPLQISVVLKAPPSPKADGLAAQAQRPREVRLSPSMPDSGLSTRRALVARSAH